jgi:hypothetical protein
MIEVLWQRRPIDAVAPLDWVGVRAMLRSDPVGPCLMCQGELGMAGDAASGVLERGPS